MTKRISLAQLVQNEAPSLKYIAPLTFRLYLNFFLLMDFNNNKK